MQKPKSIPVPCRKDDTDTQLGIFNTFERYPQAEVTLIGATGGRLDHLLANLWLGMEPRFKPLPISLLSEIVKIICLIICLESI